MSNTTTTMSTAHGGGVPARPAGPRPGRRGTRLPPQVSFALRRTGRLVTSVVIVVLATFFLVHLVPGDPVRAALGPTAPAELVASTRSQLGLDQPLGAQFIHYVTGLVTGDLGTSTETHQEVREVIGERFPVTLLLAVSGFVVALLGALIIGSLSALVARSARGRAADSLISALLGMLIAVPDFLLAVGLVAVFAVWWSVLPPAGWGGLDTAVLPVLALAVGPMAYLARIVRVEMIRVLDSTYIVTARAKRLSQLRIVARHALPNIVTSTLTVGGLLLSGLTAGTVVIETVFSIPGLGTSLVAGISAKDYPMIQGMVLVYALMVLGVNLVVDLILATVDPRTSIMEG